jgi:hypothetical protein
MDSAKLGSLDESISTLEAGLEETEQLIAKHVARRDSQRELLLNLKQNREKLLHAAKQVRVWATSSSYYFVLLPFYSVFKTPQLAHLILSSSICQISNALTRSSGSASISNASAAALHEGLWNATFPWDRAVQDWLSGVFNCREGFRPFQREVLVIVLYEASNGRLSRACYCALSQAY